MTIPVSIIMTVYNGGPYLEAAIQSLLQQTWSDFELVVIENGSTDQSPDYLRSLTDSRLRLIELERNIGRTPALNLALQETRGDYVAVQDADDISLPNRLEQQLTFLRYHPQVMLLGSWCQFVNETGDLIGRFQPPTDHQGMLDSLAVYNYNPLPHSTVMYRRLLVQALGGYPTDYVHAQDRALWLALSYRAYMANLPAELVQIRYHEGQATHSAEMRLPQFADSLRHYEAMRHHPYVSASARKKAEQAILKTRLDYATTLWQAGQTQAARQQWRLVGWCQPQVVLTHLGLQKGRQLAHRLAGTTGRQWVRQLRSNLFPN